MAASSPPDGTVGIVGVADLVAAAARAHPDKPALLEPGVEASGTPDRRLDWAGLDRAVDRVASGLGALGVVAGYRVALALGNRVEMVTGYLGVLRAQAVAVPVNPRSSAGEVARVLADSGARVVLAEPATLATVREAVALLERLLAGQGSDAVHQAHQAPPEEQLDAEVLARAVVPRVVVAGAATEDLAGAPGELSFDDLVSGPVRGLPPLRDPERLAALLYTSGTSGTPRAAMLTHRALLADLAQVAAVEPPMIREDDVVLGVLPLFHVYGLNAVLGSVLHRGATLVLVDRFEPRSTLELVGRESCTVVPVAPPVLAHWLGEPDLGERLAGVRLLLSGSAPLAPELLEQVSARGGVPVHQGYGLTEAAPVVTSTLVAAEPRPGSVGAALPGVELRLVDESGRRPEGEDPGEIEVRGPNLFSGYWPDGSDGPDPDGWWPTGDVGFLDADGQLFLVDRVKDLVIVSGFNVYPSEVEDVIREVPGVGGAAVIGVADDRTGEAVVAYVRTTGRDPASPDEVRAAVVEHCGRRLARFKQPVRVEVVEELPLTATGKVRKGRLRGIERRRRPGLLEGSP